MMSIDEFLKLPDGEIFRSGVISNSPTGIYMVDNPSIQFLRYVVVKGYINDYTIYFGKNYEPDDMIRNNGDKSINPNVSRICFSATDEVYSRYRP